MAEYDIAFAKKLAEVAGGLVSIEPTDHESLRAIAYLSRLSMELSLKALLEHVGRPIHQIRGRSHNLAALLADMSSLEVPEEVTVGVPRWCSASRVRAVEIEFSGYRVELGVVIEAEKHGASRYPNQIRYGNEVRDFPADALAAGAQVLANWAQLHWTSIRTVAKS